MGNQESRPQSQRFSMSSDEESEEDEEWQSTLFPPDIIYQRQLAHHGMPSEATCIAYEPCQGLVALGTACGWVKVLGDRGVEIVLKDTYASDHFYIRFISFSKFGDVVIAACSKGTVKVFDLQTRELAGVAMIPHQPIKITSFHSSLITDFVFLGTSHGDVRVIKVLPVCEVCDYTITLRDVGLPDQCIVTERPDHVTALESNPQDGNQLLIGYEYGGIVLWDVVGRKVLKIFCMGKPESQLLADSLRAMAWHPKGMHFAAGYGHGGYGVFRVDKTNSTLRWVDGVTSKTNDSSLRAQYTSSVRQLFWIPLPDRDTLNDQKYEALVIVGAEDALDLEHFPDGGITLLIPSSHLTQEREVQEELSQAQQEDTEIFVHSQSRFEDTLNKIKTRSGGLVSKIKAGGETYLAKTTDPLLESFQKLTFLPASPDVAMPFIGVAYAPCLPLTKTQKVAAACLVALARSNEKKGPLLHTYDLPTCPIVKASLKLCAAPKEKMKLNQALLDEALPKLIPSHVNEFAAICCLSASSRPMTKEIKQGIWEVLASKSVEQSDASRRVLRGGVLEESEKSPSSSISSESQERLGKLVVLGHQDGIISFWESFTSTLDHEDTKPRPGCLVLLGSIPSQKFVQNPHPIIGNKGEVNCADAVTAVKINLREAILAFGLQWGGVGVLLLIPSHKDQRLGPISKKNESGLQFSDFHRNKIVSIGLSPWNPLVCVAVDKSAQCSFMNITEETARPLKFKAPKKKHVLKASKIAFCLRKVESGIPEPTFFITIGNGLGVFNGKDGMAIYHMQLHRKYGELVSMSFYDPQGWTKEIQRKDFIRLAKDGLVKSFDFDSELEESSENEAVSVDESESDDEFEVKSIGFDLTPTLTTQKANPQCFPSCHPSQSSFAEGDDTTQQEKFPALVLVYLNKIVFCEVVGTGNAPTHRDDDVIYTSTLKITTSVIQTLPDPAAFAQIISMKIKNRLEHCIAIFDKARQFSLYSIDEKLRELAHEPLIPAFGLEGRHSSEENWFDDIQMLSNGDTIFRTGKRELVWISCIKNKYQASFRHLVCVNLEAVISKPLHPSSNKMHWGSILSKSVSPRAQSQQEDLTLFRVWKNVNKKASANDIERKLENQQIAKLGFLEFSKTTSHKEIEKKGEKSGIIFKKTSFEKDETRETPPDPKSGSLQKTVSFSMDKNQEDPQNVEPESCVMVDIKTFDPDEPIDPSFYSEESTLDKLLPSIQRFLEPKKKM